MLSFCFIKWVEFSCMLRTSCISHTFYFCLYFKRGPVLLCVTADDYIQLYIVVYSCQNDWLNSYNIHLGSHISALEQHACPVEYRSGKDNNQN